MPNSFDYAIIRIVPRVEREEFINVGVILFCRTCRFLETRIDLDRQRLLALAPCLDLEEVERQLSSLSVISRGDSSGGPIAALDPSGRFHWLVSPRSTVIQTSAVHSGLCADPAAMLAHLTEAMVRAPYSVSDR